jgi:hypothetical protein
VVQEEAGINSGGSLLINIKTSVFFNILRRYCLVKIRHCIISQSGIRSLVISTLIIGGETVFPLQ